MAPPPSPSTAPRPTAGRSSPPKTKPPSCRCCATATSRCIRSHDNSKTTTLPIARAIVEAYVLDPVKAPWFIDLLNINLNNHDLAVAKERISRYTEAFKNKGVRITENLDTLPAGRES